jgi:hypothetical protein
MTATKQSGKKPNVDWRTDMCGSGVQAANGDRYDLVKPAVRWPSRARLPVSALVCFLFVSDLLRMSRGLGFGFNDSDFPSGVS